MSSQGDEIFDVVVVGGGGSGLAAAIEAARFGRKVVLLEKNSALGGTTIRSVGSVTSTCTPLQWNKGIHDVPQAHFEDMALFADNRGFADKDNLELRRLLVEHSPDMVQWLMDMGVVFFGAMPEPPHRLPRMHNVLLGWTLLGWVVALVWALTKDPQDPFAQREALARLMEQPGPGDGQPAATAQPERAREVTR